MASDIKLVFHSSTIAMMHGPIKIRYANHRYADASHAHTLSSTHTH